MPYRKIFPVSLPAEDWGEIVKLAGQIEKAAMRGWLSAAEKLHAALARSLEYCCNRMDGLCQGLQKPPPNLPSLAEIYGEILALYAEFEEVEIDFKGHVLAVTTEPIVLDWLRLGAFKIRLDWNELGKTSPYRVVALDPNPAAGNDGVTHPHVQNGRLCEGEGRMAVQNALQKGRFSDFFLIVARLLQTYARGSAYVEIDDWEGVSCDDCGGNVYTDDR